MDFADISHFDWDNALYALDTRENYDEVREIGYGLFFNRLIVVVFTERKDHFRVISWRKATSTEERLYEKKDRN